MSKSYHNLDAPTLISQSYLLEFSLSKYEIVSWLFALLITQIENSEYIGKKKQLVQGVYSENVK